MMMSILSHSLCLSLIVCCTKSDYEFDCKPAGVVLCHHFHGAPHIPHNPFALYNRRPIQFPSDYHNS